MYVCTYVRTYVRTYVCMYSETANKRLGGKGKVKCKGIWLFGKSLWDLDIRLREYGLPLLFDVLKFNFNLVSAGPLGDCPIHRFCNLAILQSCTCHDKVS